MTTNRFASAIDAERARVRGQAVRPNYFSSRPGGGRFRYSGKPARRPTHVRTSEFFAASTPTVKGVFCAIVRSVAAPPNPPSIEALLSLPTRRDYDERTRPRSKILNPLLFFSFRTPLRRPQARSDLSDELPKNGDVPKSPFPQFGGHGAIGRHARTLQIEL